MYVFRDHGVLTAHDTGNAHGLVCIADHEHGAVHGALLAVQGGEFLAILCPADDDLMTGDGIQIISVHGLAVLFHDVVGDIYHVIDGTDAMGRQPSLHPHRRRCKFDVLYHPGTVSGAEIFVLYLHFDVVVHILAVACLGDHRRIEILVEGGCCLSCQTDDGETVNPVGSDLVLYHHVMQAQRLDGVTAHNRIISENIDAVLRCLRVHISAGAQLLDGAEHTVGLHAAQLAFFDLDAARGLLAVMAASHPAAV